MFTFVLDADVTIKLVKAEVFDKLITFSNCIMTKQVYEEIIKGKEKMYEDAFIIEDYVELKKVKLINIKSNRIHNLGIGESSILEAIKVNKFDSIISDDRRFLSKLKELNISFITAVDVIIMLYLAKKISQIDVVDALDKIKNIMRPEHYLFAKEFIGGKK